MEVYELSSAFEDEFIYAVQAEFPPNKYVDLARSYYNDALSFFNNFDGLEDFTILGVEEKFNEPISNNLCLTGFIDLILKTHDNKLIIQDWKSKSKFKNKTEQAEYARQLYLYSLYIKNKYGRYPDLLKFYMFRKQSTVEIPFNINDLHEAIDWMNDTVTQIRACAEWIPTCDEWFCHQLCDYRNSCPYVKEGGANPYRSKKSRES